jgi:putative Holliday junction resolvase
MRIIGLDVGTKNIGVAVSDESGTLAQGREVIPRKSDKDAIVEIKDVIDEYKVKEIVVGIPLNMDGSKGERALDSEKFADILRKETLLPVKLWDERFTTKEAEAVLLRADVSREKRKKLSDKLAAQLILQSYLDSLKTKG